MKKILSFVLLGAALASCSLEYAPDIDSGLTALRLKASTAPAVLAAPAADNIALTLSWTNENEGASTTIEMSADSLFSTPYSQIAVPGTDSQTYTFRELNDIMMTSLGMEQGRQATLYVRLAASIGDASVYSNFVGVTVTPGAILASPVLNCSTTEIALVKSTPNRLALSFSWTENGLGVENTLEISTENEFLEPYTVSATGGVRDIQFTYGRLNDILVKELGMSADVQDTVYFRVVSSFETSAAYSNTIAVAVTPEATVTEENRLYIGGFSAADPWNFDDYLVCYNEEYKAYSGVHYAQSKWGYRLYPEKDNWDLYYTMASGGTATSGYLTPNGSGNITAPADGLYLLDVNLSSTYYKLYEVTSVSYTGFNDNWNLTTMTQNSDDPTVYTAKVTITKPASYRWQIIISKNWDLKLCATGGKLLLYNEGPATDEIPNGTYTLTVNLGTSTYTLE